MVKRLCISVPDEDAEYIEVNNISPSSFLQQEIQRMREYDAGRKDLLMKIQVREEHIVKLNQKIMELQEKIDSTGNNGVI